MKTMLILTALILASSPALAIDRINLSCGNSKIIVNILEHRGPDGMSRDTDIEIVYGNRDLKGVFNSEDPSFQKDASGFQSIYVNGKKEDSEFFTGKIKIDYEAPKVTLHGRLQLSGRRRPLPVQATYLCQFTN